MSLSLLLWFACRPFEQVFYRIIQALFYTGEHMNIKITPIDGKVETEGSWGIYRGVKLLIARDSNIKFKRFFRQISKPYKHDIDTNTLEEAKAEELMASAYAETILLNWENFPGDLEYSKANAESLIKSDSDCYDYIKDFSKNLDNYIKNDEELALGEQ